MRSTSTAIISKGLTVMAAAAIIAAPANGSAQAGASAKPTGQYADVNGIKLYYEIHGQGRPLVLLHGGLGALEMFGPTLDALAASHQVIAVDLQGHGRTADVDRPLSIITMSDDIAALINYLKLQRPDVVGYSLGGGVALQTAVRHPELVGKLVLVSTPFRRNGFYPDILRQQALVNAQAAEGLKQTPMYQMYVSLAPRPQDFPRLLDKIGEAMKVDYDFTEDVRGLKPTTLIVAGDADIFPPSHAVEMFNLIGGGLRDAGWDGSGQSKNHLAILPGVTHYNMAVAPALAPTIISFLDAKP